MDANEIEAKVYKFIDQADLKVLKESESIVDLTLTEKTTDAKSGYITGARMLVIDPKSRTSHDSIELNFEGKYVYHPCTCTYYQRTGEPCRHSYAVAKFIEKYNQDIKSGAILPFANNQSSKGFLKVEKVGDVFRYEVGKDALNSEFIRKNILSPNNKFETYPVDIYAAIYHDKPFQMLQADFMIRNASSFTFRIKPTYTGMWFEYNFYLGGKNLIIESAEKRGKGDLFTNNLAGILLFIVNRWGADYFERFFKVVSETVADYGFDPQSSDFLKYLKVGTDPTGKLLIKSDVFLPKKPNQNNQFNLQQFKSEIFDYTEVLKPQKAKVIVARLADTHVFGLIIQPGLANLNKSGTISGFQPISELDIAITKVDDSEFDLFKKVSFYIKNLEKHFLIPIQYIDESSEGWNTRIHVGVYLIDLLNRLVDNHRPIHGVDIEERIGALYTIDKRLLLPTLEVSESRDKKFYQILPKVVNPDSEINSILEAKLISGSIPVLGDKIFVNYSPYTVNAIAFSHSFEKNSKLLMPQKGVGFAEFFNNQVAKASVNHYIDLKIKKNIEYDDIKPIRTRIYMRDRGADFISFYPYFVYQRGDETTEIAPRNSGIIMFAPNNETVTCLKLDSQWEEHQLTYIQELHPKFDKLDSFGAYNLSVNEMLLNDWFYEFYEGLRNAEMELLGLNISKNFKINPVRPSIKVSLSSGINWFGIYPEVSFGKIKLPFRDFRDAVLAGRNYIELSDGTIGQLPQEWIEKFGELYRISKEKSEIKISDVHVNTIEQIDPFIDDNQSRKILEKQQAKLQAIAKSKKIETIEKPTKILATLRPYQLEGLNWLVHLHQIGWGGCLADDMGLGKTLQVISFFEYLNQNGLKKGLPHLVVVPNSLIFNWKNEIIKFASHLTVYVHHGSDRKKYGNPFEGYDVVLTTYATLRNDIEWLKTFEFNYQVIDEAQAIKNPLSQISETVIQINAKNRIALSGTPIENTTFDLFSILNFLNPGMLGEASRFKANYATPIEKNKNAGRAEELKKLTSPFVLRRTKEAVAKDLPEKTETIIWCEMGKEQTKMYEEVRQEFLDKIENLLYTVGRKKIGMHVLSGLTKLRQICSMPALIKPTEELTINGSAKLEELMEQLREITLTHKVLVFGQFLETLKVLSNHLDREGIGHVYLDGQTTNREGLVNQFQSIPSKRVFLISLKAGGTGLNLTAAEYVYILEPWWNPAVEQQAIDRTHRIGQENHVFAYKMLCKNTIEEKMIVLQERKSKLASDLISADEGIISSLSDDELLNLFR